MLHRPCYCHSEPGVLIPVLVLCILMMAQRHPKMEMDRADLLQLLSHMEGEMQARDVAIAALRVGS